MVISILLACVAVAPAQDPRRVLSLDGVWEIAEGSLDRVPARFERTAPVPGLADMASPPFEEVGVKSARRDAFWYRRTFKIDGPVPSVALLKIHKARYGTRVHVNGSLAGDNAPCFTPGVFDVRSHLRGGGATNELVVRVGAFRDALPSSIPGGWDFEKVKYIPGIFDAVELILSGTPHIGSVQVAPDVPGRAARIRAVVRNAGPEADGIRVAFRVREAASGKTVGEGRSEALRLGAGGEAAVDVRIPIDGCRLWSPEDPFLYALEVETGGDRYETRFGMRSFAFDRARGRAILNGKTRFLRGTNVCVYRFFEDPARGDRPWREEWVRRLHRAFRSMHWDSIRYCIGFPPEVWYRVADEEGFLIQDEFPLWGLAEGPEPVTAKELAREYAAWMEERANHPCVVIWDAQNETRTDETGKAIGMVRGLDLSGRPWDNGWAPPQTPDDVYESHPYLFINAAFRLSDLAGVSGVPRGNPIANPGNPIVINEYGWLWLNRDGTPTTLSKKVYENILGPDATVDALRETYARYLAALTEFWRGHRACAGVLHFCGLGYSRAGGQTSDHFIDIERLTFEPYFARYVRDAFAPVGLMIDEWAEELPAGAKRTIPVVVINDLPEDREVTVGIWLGQDGHALHRDEARWPISPNQTVSVPAFGDVRLTFWAEIPSRAGRYRLVADLARSDAPPVRSIREFEVLTEAERAAREGIARGARIRASSTVTVNGESFPPENAVDGKRTTRWSSEFSDPQWIAIDLGEPVEISRVQLLWEAAYGKAYAIEVSLDGEAWTEVFRTAEGDGGTDDIRFAPARARWVRMRGSARGTQFGYSLWEFRVFE
ncbi:MAG: discoidin domain-containing protein [Planctomycetes bacterium]|nr:discoidin domain-containing protein [Planctomycetota bacterium]